MHNGGHTIRTCRPARSWARPAPRAAMHAAPAQWLCDGDERTAGRAGLCVREIPRCELAYGGEGRPDKLVRYRTIRQYVTACRGPSRGDPWEPDCCRSVGQRGRRQGVRRGWAHLGVPGRRSMGERSMNACSNGSVHECWPSRLLWLRAARAARAVHRAVVICKPHSSAIRHQVRRLVLAAWLCPANPTSVRPQIERVPCGCRYSATLFALLDCR